MKYTIEDVEYFVENNLKAHELLGVEFTEEDYEIILERANEYGNLEKAGDEYMSEVRELLDWGIEEDDIEENEEDYSCEVQ